MAEGRNQAQAAEALYSKEKRMLDRLGLPLDLLNKKLWLFDMDGTIYQEDRLFDGTLDLLYTIRQMGGHYVFITNNSSKSVDDYVAKVNGMGIAAGKKEFFTSTNATVQMLLQKHPGARVYCQGTGSLVKELQAAGISVTEAVEAVDVVLIGFDLELTSQKLRNTCQILTEQPNVAFYATNPDLVCPVSFGFVPDCGSICAMLQNATGRSPVYIGKPEPTMVKLVMERFGYPPEQTVVVGDRAYTDIASGVRAGVSTIGVLSGEATEADFRAGPCPSYVFQNVREIQRALQELLAQATGDGGSHLVTSQ